ncbi:TetR/AcrR family transcriptional regulator [Roseibium sp.]|uniref:TetR/AcrR family transcriptional regulator n=1 Tax=Roseibium sp. TaxID=1936156 RepID=UPI003A985DF6
MARPREFDLDEAMTGAMRLFWSKGYEEASLAELLKAMKITKGSFYKAFADKNSVYLQALDLYDKNAITPTVQRLADPSLGSGCDRIVALFENVAKAAASNGDRTGCFLCNALVDRAVEDPAAEEKLQRMVLRLETAFRGALAESDPSRDADWTQRTARGVLSSYIGLRVLGRAGLSKDMSDDCVNQIRSVISGK